MTYSVSKHNDKWCVVFSGRVVEGEIRSRAAAQQIAHAYNVACQLTPGDKRTRAALAEMELANWVRAELINL